MKLSIVIPVLNESALIVEALAGLRRLAPQAEILVVDGGSNDDTARLAVPYARVLDSPPGRAAQMNLGAAEAAGDWLLFLHLDTRLPEDFPSAIATAEKQGVQAGVFHLRIVGRHPLLPLLSLGANLRTRFLRVFLGDQGLFVTRALFLSLGGFPRLPLLEDFEFSRMLKRASVPFHFSPLRVETSGRRWDHGGFFSTWWQFRRILFQYHRRGTADAAVRSYQDIR